MSEFTVAEQNPVPQKAKKKKKHKWVKRAVIAVILLGLGFGAWKLFGAKGNRADEVMTDFVSVGSITSTVTGSGLTKARNSETLTLTTTGTVMDVYVTEGQRVEAGEPLLLIDSPAAETAYTNAKNKLDGYRRQLSAAQKDIAGLNLSATYGGKLLKVVTLHTGDEITKGQRVATLADDTYMRLTQYYSYAYADSLSVGQTAEVSVPVLMSTLPGTIESVNMVSRITPEGSRLFSATILVRNDGALTVDMAAAATVRTDGGIVYPYEAGKLEYRRVGDLCSTVNGTVLTTRLCDYLQVEQGEVLVTIDGEDSENEIFTIEQNIQTAEEDLEAAEKNRANCKAAAPISGTVIGLTLGVGDAIPANTALLTISDTGSILINATVDERNVSYLKPGMPVDLDQWGNMAFGTIETVSLSSTVANGVATYPVTISVDNPDGRIQLNSYISYSLMASQSENCLTVPIQCVRTAALEDGSIITVVYVRGEVQEPAAVTARDEDIPEDFTPVQVEIGIQDASNVEIKSGLTEGMEVFTQKITTQAWG